MTAPLRETNRAALPAPARALDPLGSRTPPRNSSSASIVSGHVHCEMD